MMDHAQIVAGLSPKLIPLIIDDLKKRNLRDYRDHETRWTADRLRALKLQHKANLKKGLAS